MTKRTHKENKSAYHTENREPPIAHYIGQLIYAHTRKTDTVLEKLSHLDSSNCLNQISTTLGNTAIDTFEQEHVVYPLEMNKGFYTIGDIDNIDVNPSSSTAMPRI